MGYFIFFGCNTPLLAAKMCRYSFSRTCSPEGEPTMNTPLLAAG